MRTRILAIHTTGMIGKSTITASLLYPRLRQPVGVYSLEEINEDAARYGIPIQRYRAAEFPMLWADLITDPADLILDVGASTYIAVMEQLTLMRGAVNDFDLVVVPTTPDRRVQSETVTTISNLVAAGIARICAVPGCTYTRTSSSPAFIVCLRRGAMKCSADSLQSPKYIAGLAEPENCICARYDAVTRTCRE